MSLLIWESHLPCTIEKEEGDIHWDCMAKAFGRCS